jgi:hypothetical protein
MRRTLDLLLSAAGAVLAIVLLVAGGLLMWGYTFADDEVHDQLAAQKIFFPPKGSPALTPKEFPDLQKYAGEQVVNGDQAQAYADGFIARHLEEVANGQTYSQVSAQVLQNPDDVKLKGQQETLFRGETLRGLLLNAYAFWQIAQIALYAAIISFILGAVMAVLSFLGFRHMRKMSAAAAPTTPSTGRGPDPESGGTP